MRPLEDLRRRIGATNWPEKETVADQSQGVPLAMIQKLARYWMTDYDWRKCEANLNALPQFITEIDGLEIHFIHARSRHDDALPLIVNHGWPGSIIEQLKIIDRLTDPTAHGARAADAFDTPTCLARFQLTWTRLPRPATRRHPDSQLRNDAPMSSCSEPTSKSSTPA
jgi:Epoxide hydrolase N terminus